jgi:Peptidase E
MRKILLTSNGLATDRIISVFHSLLEKQTAEAKALFIPTAANTPEAIFMVPECLKDLLNAGISEENITVFDLYRNMAIEELSQYDTVCFTGGTSQYLLDRINDTGFSATLTQYVDNGGVYLGISAGSVVATNNLPNNLGFINCKLGVHKEIGTARGVIDVSKNPHIDLTGSNAILILGDRFEIVE